MAVSHFKKVVFDKAVCLFEVFPELTVFFTDDFGHAETGSGVIKQAVVWYTIFFNVPGEQN